MGRVAVQAAQAVRYVGAGTVEFLLDEDGHFYFMEMNTRIQVEHPVTEMVTGADLVKDQIRVAAGEPLGYRQKDVVIRGASIECRINAEDPTTFMPSPGKIHAFHIPGGPGVRVDTAAHAECTVPPYYDSLIAKLVVHARDRREAIERMRRCLRLTVIEGVKTTIPLQLRVLDDPDFRAGKYSTRFLERFA
jgi:acetyl-CoA carboxylase biotin carboxylase subunit